MMDDLANRGRNGMSTRWGDQLVIAEPESVPSKSWRTYFLRPIWWLISRLVP